MTGTLNTGALLLQASSCLALGLLGSYLWARKPARGHQGLLICTIACVVLPVLYTAVQWMGLGQLRNDLPTPALAVEPFESAQTYESVEALGLPLTLEPLPEILPTLAAPVTSLETEPIPRHPIPWALLSLAIWGIMSCLALARLVLQFVLGLRLVRHRKSVEDDSLLQALRAARKRLHMDGPVTLCFSQKITSPVIWCWFKTPILLIQDISNAGETCRDWVGVFCHELAHARRLDHITNLWADLLCIALPWHPLVWWSRQRLIRLSEDVCDDWVLAQGQVSTRYAESLLALSTQKQLALLPRLIGKDSTMKERIHRIVKGQFSNPKPGTGWTCLLVTVTLCSIVGMALAQPRPDEDPPAVAMEVFEEPVAIGVINAEAEPKEIDIAVIGRLNVLNRLLDQLTDQCAKTERVLGQAKNDSDRRMHKVELDTLREQIDRIKKQIQITKHPDEERTLFRTVRATTRTTRGRSSTSPPQDERTLRSGSAKERRIATTKPTEKDDAVWRFDGGRWVPTTERDTPNNLSWYYQQSNDPEAQKRVLTTRHRQILEELKAIGPDLRRRHEAGLIPTSEMDSRLRPLRNELGLIEAQLGHTADSEKKQTAVYKLKHGRASQIADIMTRLVSRDEIVVSDQDTNSIIIHAAPDKHQKIQELMVKLDTPRTITPPRTTSSSVRTARSTNRTAPTTSTAPRRFSTTSAATRSPTNTNLNAEVDNLRGQVKGLNDQMKEMRAMLELLIQQKKTEEPVSSLPPASNRR